MTVRIEVEFEERLALSEAEKSAVSALSESCKASDGIDPSLFFDTHLNADRDMSAWFLAWGRGRGEARSLLGAARLFAPSRDEGELSVAVDGLYRLQGIFMELYRMATAALRAAGIPALLLAVDGRRGYGRVMAGRLDMERSHGEYLMSLSRGEAAAGEAPESVRLVPVSRESLDEAVGMSVAIFGDSPADARSFISATLADPLREQFLAFGAGGPAGMVALSDSGSEAMVHGLGVLPELRGRGLGGAILDACLAVLFARGRERVTLEVGDENLAAIALYRSRGFRDESMTDYWRKDLGA